MITYSGVHIQTIGGADGIPTSRDIAVHAGRLCRFGGAIWYPLLPHLVFVGLLAYKRSNSIANLLWGFLHDAHEVVTSDVPRPFKCDCMRKEQKALDRRLLNEYFSTALEREIDFELIHECDLIACDIEATELGLTNFREVKSEIGENLRLAEPDIELFHKIMLSSFAHDTTNDISEGVLTFSDLLDVAANEGFGSIIYTLEAEGLL